MKLGIIREGKIPRDKRVPFTPAQCRVLTGQYPGLEILIQPSEFRCFTDEEYAAAGFTLTNDLTSCDIVAGIKEVPVQELLAGKTYMFFSHTIKKQPHNRAMLKTIIEKKIRLIDYECLTYPDHQRVIGFGHFAGIVGLHNALIGFGKRYGLYQLKPAHLCRNKEEMYRELARIGQGIIANLEPYLKIVITGEGRVSGGAREALAVAGINQVTPALFLEKKFRKPVFCQLGVTDYNKRKDKKNGSEKDFYVHPDQYETAFIPFTSAADIFVSCHFWDPRAPRLFTGDDMKKDGFNIRVIADISCDINGSVPSTIRASSVDNPFYGFNPATASEDDPYKKECITVMAVDNLPCELPRDASEYFGNELIKNVIPSLNGRDESRMIERATIAVDGRLTDSYRYLNDYISEVQ